MKIFDYPLVMVEWVDAEGGSNGGWRDMEDCKRAKLAQAKSVGWLVYKDKYKIVVIPHIVDEETGEDMGDGEMAIPKSWITKINYLQPPE